jgi:hypothetical protein
MKCQFCQSQLPQEAHACPSCGALAAEASGPTAASMNAQQSAVSYGSNPYSDQSNPYATFVPPSPPQAPRQKKLALIIGMSLLILVFLAAIPFAWFSWLSPQKGSQTFSKLDATEAQALYSRTIHGRPDIHDTLAGPDNYGWDDYAEANTSCAFSGNAYHTQAKPGYFSPCYAKATNYGDSLFQVQVTIVSGHSAGIVFHANSTNDKGYQFRISTDGTYILNMFYLDNKGQAQEATLVSGHSSAIIAGTNQSNLVSVLVQGVSIYLFVNHTYVDSTSDVTYQSGQIGVYVDSDTDEVNAMFRNVEVWKL